MTDHVGVSRKSLVFSTEAKGKLWAVIMLSLPTIVGTLYFLAGVIQWRVSPPSNVDPWRPLTNAENVALTASIVAYFAGYVGAAFGPFLLPFAAYSAWKLTRDTSVRSSTAIWAWTFVALGLAAAVFFWSWLSKQNIFI